METKTQNSPETARKSAIAAFSAEGMPATKIKNLIHVTDKKLLTYQHGDKKGYLIPGIVLLVVRQNEWEVYSPTKRTNLKQLMKDIEDGCVFLFPDSHPHIVKTKSQ